MASNVVNVVVRADSSQLSTAFDQSVSAGERFKAKMALVGQAVVAALAFKALGAVKDFVGDSVRAFSDLNESLNAVEVTYGRNAEGIKRLGEQAARSLGLSNAEFNSFAVSIANFAEQIAGPGGDIVGVVDELTKRVTDFASVMNLDVATAQEKFQSGLAGQSRPLREFGIDVSDAAIKSFALANGIGTVGKELTEGEKVQARYGAIMEQTAKMAGDFANTSEDLANKQRIVAAETENAKAKLGEALAPAMLQVADVGGDLITVLGGVFDAMNNLAGDGGGGGVGGLVKQLIPFGRELDWLKDRLGDWADSTRESEERQNALDSAVRRVTHGQYEFNTEMKSGRPVLDATTRAVDNLESAEDDLEDATEDANKQIKTQAQLLRDANSELRASVDPVFKFQKGQQDLAEATERYNAAVKEFGANSPQAIEAAQDIAEANLDIRDAVADVSESTMDMQDALASVGIPQSVITALKSDIGRMREMLHNANLKMRIGVTAPTMHPTSPRGGGVGWESRTKTYYHSGGIVQGPPGADVPIIAQAGEEIIPRSEVNGRSKDGGIHFHNPTFYGTGDFERVIQEVIVRARRKGMKI